MGIPGTDLFFAKKTDGDAYDRACSKRLEMSGVKNGEQEFNETESAHPRVPLCNARTRHLRMDALPLYARVHAT